MDESRPLASVLDLRSGDRLKSHEHQRKCQPHRYSGRIRLNVPKMAEPGFGPGIKFHGQSQTSFVSLGTKWKFKPKNMPKNQPLHTPIKFLLTYESSEVASPFRIHFSGA